MLILNKRLLHGASASPLRTATIFQSAVIEFAGLAQASGGYFYRAKNMLRQRLLCQLRVPPNMTRLVITAMVLVISSQAYAISAKDRLVNALKAVRTINGTFSQTTSGSKTLKGNFKIKRPNKFIWVYGGKDGQKIISTGKRVWIEEPDLEHAYHLSLKRALGKSPALLLLNPGKLSKEFNLFSSGKQAGLDWVELKPKSRGNAEFEKLFVGLNSKGIKQIKIIDALNRTTVINFTSLHFDRPLSDNLFKYTPPSEFDSF